MMNKWLELTKNLTMLTQFGLSLITPVLMCLALCWFLNVKAGLPAWIYIPGFFFGLGGSGMVAWKLYLSQMKHLKKDQGKHRISFNRHI